MGATFLQADARQLPFATPVVAWVSRSGVAVYLNDDEREDRVGLTLSVSPQFAYLQHLEKSQPNLSQRDLLTALRIKLKDCQWSAPHYPRPQ